jgi:hypothetical protein
MGADPFEVTDEQHPKVDARRDARTARFRVMGLAQRFDPLIEPGSSQQAIQLLIEHVPGRRWQLPGRHSEFRLPLFGAPS